MELYNNNLFYGAMFAAVIFLQLLWLRIPAFRTAADGKRQNGRVTFAVFCVCTALAVSTLFRLFPGNCRAPAEDSSVFLYIGKRMTEGKLPYRDLFDHKGPILYLIQYLGLRLTPGSYTGVWILEVLNMLAAVACMVRLGRIAAKERTSAFLAVLAAAGVCGWKIWQGGNFTEEYALPWIAASACIFFSFFQTKHYRRREIVFLGIAFSVVFLLRANMIAVWAVCIPAVMIILLREKRGPELAGCLLLFSAGMLAVFLPVLIWAHRMNCLEAMWKDYIVFNFAYSEDAAAHFGTVLMLMGISAILIWPGTLAMTVCLLRKPGDRIQWMNALFFLVSLYSAAMGGRGFFHYTIILLPAAVLPLTGFFDLTAELIGNRGTEKYRVRDGVMMLSFLLMLSCALVYREKSSGDAGTDPVTQFLQENTESGNDVLILGNSCRYYLEADRKTENLYFYQTPPLEISDELFLDFLKELEEHPSDTIILPGTEAERSDLDCRLHGIRELLEISFGYYSETYGQYEVLIRAA